MRAGSLPASTSEPLFFFLDVDKKFVRSSNTRLTTRSVVLFYEQVPPRKWWCNGKNGPELRFFPITTMTEANENGAVLVRLRALVMQRDDTSDGWFALAPGTLANVSLIKQIIPVSHSNNNITNTTVDDNNTKFLSPVSSNCSGGSSCSRTSSSSSSSNASSNNSLNTNDNNHHHHHQQQQQQQDNNHHSNNNNSSAGIDDNVSSSNTNNHNNGSSHPPPPPPRRHPQHSHRHRHQPSSKQSPPQQFEYIIYGHTIPDNSLIFRSIIGPDFEYNKVMPTFHNWQSGGTRLGLIFQTAADGRAFDRKVMDVLVLLVNGPNLKSTECPIDTDNEIFMTIDLPYKLDDLQSMNTMNITAHASPSCTESFISSCTVTGSGNTNRGTTTTTTRSVVESTDMRLASRLRQQSPHYSITGAAKYRTAAQTGTTNSTVTISSTATGTIINMSQQQQQQQQQYCTPESPSALKKPSATYEEASSYVACDLSSGGDPVPADFTKQRLVCRHCRQAYVESENIKGSCDHAPDCVRTGIDTVTCIPCARSVVYHCVSTSEVAQQPCECDSSHEAGCSRRWIGLALLSILLPCLWCYPPLKVCHLCGVSCGACGGRHEPLNTTSSARS